MKTIVKTLCVAVMLVCLAASCSSYKEEHEQLKLLNSAAGKLEDDPEQSLACLQQVNAGLLDVQEYAYYTLLQARARDKAGANIAALEESVRRAKEVVLTKYQPERAAYACFVLAKVYEAQKQPLKALHEYLQADNWASKVNYDITNLGYPRIAYNVALLYFNEQNFKASQNYTDMAFAHLNDQYPYILELKLNELVGLNFQKLEDVDKSLIYYNKALEIASKHNDIISKNRIVFNIITLFHNNEKYEFAEERCKEQLLQASTANDRFHAGLLYNVLANIYINTGKFTLAKEFIVKAEKMLVTVENNQIKLSLLKTFYLLEKGMGNIKKAAIYKQQFNSINSAVEACKAEQLASIERETMLAKQKGETAREVLEVVDANRRSFRSRLIAGRVAFYSSTVLLLAACVSVYLRYRKRRNEGRELCREELLLSVSQRRTLEQLYEDLQHMQEGEHKAGAYETIDNLQTILYMSPLLSYTYGQLYSKLRSSLPEFTAQELEVLWLAKTGLLKKDEIRDYFSYSAEDFKLVWQSMLVKLKARRKTFRIGGVMVMHISADDAGSERFF